MRHVPSVLLLRWPSSPSPAPASAQTPSAAEPSVVVTTGEGVIKRAPDRAWVTIAAESRAKTPQEAQRLNTDAMTAVVEKIKGVGLPADAIQTSGYNLQPEFDYANNKQTLRGYVARNQVQVRVDVLPKTGEVIDVAVAAGATNVSGVRFDLKDRDRRERRRRCSAPSPTPGPGRDRGAGRRLKVDRVVRIEEQREMISPPRPMMMAMRPRWRFPPSRRSSRARSKCAPW